MNKRHNPISDSIVLVIRDIISNIEMNKYIDKSAILRRTVNITTDVRQIGELAIEGSEP